MDAPLVKMDILLEAIKFANIVAIQKYNQSLKSVTQMETIIALAAKYAKIHIPYLQANAHSAEMASFNQRKNYVTLKEILNALNAHLAVYMEWVIIKNANIAETV